MTGLQLTRRQYYALCTMVLLSPLLHLVPRKTTAEAGCGGWLCALAALVPLLLFAWILEGILHRGRPGEGIGEITLRALGPVAGRVLLGVYALWFLLYSAFALRIGAERFIEAVFPLSRPWPFVVTILAMAVCGALGSTKALFRASEIFLPLLMLVLALVLALMVDNIKVGAKFFRTVYFFPIVISATALGLLFNLIFLYDGGMLNQLLQNLGLAAENIDWKDPAHFFVTMMVPVIWQYVGFYFVILVTGLNNISTDIYEAAEIDGASGLGRIRYITLPLLHNTLCTCLVLAITGSLKVFDLPWTMFVGGLPLDKSWLTGTYMYYQTMVLQDVDYGSAIAILIVVLGVVISQIANRIFKEKDY